jgi:Uma2 family endonuclease
MARVEGIAEDLCTVEDFFALVGDGQKADLIDGVIHMASPDTNTANLLTGLVYQLLDGFVAARQVGGRVFVTRFAFQLSDVRAPEPDVAYVRPERLHLVRENCMLGGPDLAVEIVSRDSRHRDYHEKRELYEQAGVTEYWIVDPIVSRVEFLRLQEGKYELVPLERNRIFHSSVVNGFWLDVDWLLANPPPAAYNCLQQVLAGEPQ